MRYIFFFCFILVFSGPLSSSPTIVTEDAKYNLARHLEILKTDEDLKIEDVVKNQSWKSNDRDSIKEGFSTDHFWLHFSVKNLGEGSFWFLVLSLNQIDIADLYIKGSDGSYEKKISGDYRPYSSWDQKYPYPTFRIYLEKNQTEDFYLHVKSTSTVTFYVSLFGPGAMSEFHIRNNFIQWAYFTITLLYILSLFLIYRKSGNKSYLYSIPITFVFYLYLFFISGNSYQFWPEWTYFQDRSMVITAVIFLLMILYFLREFLQLQQLQPVMYWIFNALIILTLPGFWFLKEISKFMHYWLIVHALVIYLLVLAAVFRTYMTGLTYVRYLFILWILIGGGAIIRGLTLMEIIPYSRWTFNAAFYIYPISLILIFKTLYDKYMQLLSENKLLQIRYRKLITELDNNSSHSRIKNLNVDDVLGKLKNLTEDGIVFLEPGFTLNSLGKLLGIRPDQVSELLNSELNISFSNFLNTIRIQKACELIQKFPEKTILQIGFDVGFGSKSNFNRTFRELTGMTPHDYKKHSSGFTNPQNIGSFFRPES